jgi:hypothetical protein
MQPTAIFRHASTDFMKRLMRSVEVRLDGTLPATKSAALRNSYGYRYLLTRNLCPHYSVTNVA